MVHVYLMDIHLSQYMSENQGVSLPLKNQEHHNDNVKEDLLSIHLQNIKYITFLFSSEGTI